MSDVPRWILPGTTTFKEKSYSISIWHTKEKLIRHLGNFRADIKKMHKCLRSRAATAQCPQGVQVLAVLVHHNDVDRVLAKYLRFLTFVLQPEPMRFFCWECPPRTSTTQEATVSLEGCIRIGKTCTHTRTHVTQHLGSSQTTESITLL